jgi:MFS family permease
MAASTEASSSLPASSRSQSLAIRLSMAMFVLVVDTSLMNVSISSVVHDLNTTVSGVQSAMALEALVSAAFILIGSKIGDLYGRKRAYVVGLLGYAVGRPGDDPGSRTHGNHHFLGFDRRSRRFAAAALDAVPGPRQLRRRGPPSSSR